MQPGLKRIGERDTANQHFIESLLDLLNCYYVKALLYTKL